MNASSVKITSDQGKGKWAKQKAIHNRCRANWTAHYWSPLPAMGHTAVSVLTDLGPQRAMVLSKSPDGQCLSFLALWGSHPPACLAYIHSSRAKKEPVVFHVGSLNDSKLPKVFRSSFVPPCYFQSAVQWSLRVTSMSLSLSYLCFCAPKSSCPTETLLYFSHPTTALSWWDGIKRHAERRLTSGRKWKKGIMTNNIV